MPKIRTAGASLSDALKHLRIFQARIGNDASHQASARKINEASLLIQQEMIKFPMIENEINLYSDEQLNSASILIQKEMKKDIPKIDPKEILKHVYNTTNQRNALEVALSAGLTRDQALRLIIRAPHESNLGKAISKLKPIIKAPIVAVEEVIEDNITNYSEADDELKRALMGE